MLTRYFRGTHLLDPIVYWGWRLNRWWHRVGHAERYDAVHIATQVQGLAFARLDPRIPYSLSIDVTRKLVLANSYWPDDASPKAIAREKLIFDRAAVIASMSSWAARSLVYEYGVANHKILVVPPSIVLPPPPQRPVQNNSLVNVGFVGNDFVRKGGETLLNLHQEKYREQVRLHIVSGQYRPPAELFNVVHHKYIPNARIMDEFFRRMDIFCLPTQWDMSPWVVVEASAAGLPVVVSDVGGIPDLCRNEETGFLLPTGDAAALDRALSRLLADPALRVHLGQGGYRYVRDHLNAESNYNRLIDAIAGIC